MQIHQLVHTLNYGDAISGEAITIRRLLAARGIQGNIYSVHAHEKVKDQMRPWRYFEEDRQAAAARAEPILLILHFSIASPLNDLFLAAQSVTKAVIYHNLTPPRWFANYNSRVYADLQQGVKELATIAQAADLIFADSEFNKIELIPLVSKPVDVLPLPLDLTKWSVAANPGIANLLQSSGEVNLLHVGRLAPNKCVEDIIKIFYFYHHKIQRRSKLWLIGIDIDTEIYSFELRRLLSRLNLKHSVEFVGAVADSELRSFYENSAVYLCMSEHEGFCLPLLEAMYFRLPVIAYAACAVPETVGDAGVLVQRKAHAELAELVNLVATDNSLRGPLVEAGLRRVDDFSETSFQRLLDQLLINSTNRVPGSNSSATLAESDGHRNWS